MPAGNRLDRATGALLAGALGDALGMPTQVLSPERIAQLYGRVDRFVAPTDDHPVSAGLPAGSVTDDTEQALLLARVLLSCRSRFDHGGWVRALGAWEDDIRARGGHDLLGPSTKRALEAIAAGVPPEVAGRHGDTNGAAMRIAPVGILVPPDPLEELVSRVAEASAATHFTGLAISAASAVAAAVSAGVEGATWPQARRLAIAAARMGRRRGNWVAGADIAARIEWAAEATRGLAPDEGAAFIRDLVGTSVASQESVPAAFALVDLADGDPWTAAVLAANLGGDTDTIGAIAGAMAGSVAGARALPRDRLAELRGVDLGEVEAIAAALLERRAAIGGGARP